MPRSSEARQPSRSRNYSTDEDWSEARRGGRNPERVLWFHVLRRQIWDFVLYRNSEPGTEEYQLAEDAAGWIWWDGEEDIDETGRPTFHYICCVLEVTPASIRNAALQLTRESISRLNNQIKEDG